MLASSLKNRKNKHATNEKKKNVYIFITVVWKSTHRIQACVPQSGHDISDTSCISRSTCCKPQVHDITKIYNMNVIQENKWSQINKWISNHNINQNVFGFYLQRTWCLQGSRTTLMGSSKQTLHRIFSWIFQLLNRYYHPWLNRKILERMIGWVVLRFEASRTLAGYKWWYLFAHSTQLVVSISSFKRDSRSLLGFNMFLKN